MSDFQNKRKFDDKGSGVSYNRVPPPLSDFELAKQKAEQIAARLVAQDSKKSRFDDRGLTSNSSSFGEPKGSPPQERSPGKLFQNLAQVQTGSEASTGSYFSMQGTPESRKVEIPNAKVGLVIGKGGETIKYIQQQAGARIQITRDADHDASLPYRMVELMGTPEQISRAEQLIQDVIAEADAGGNVSSGYGAQSVGEQVQMSVPTNKVGLIIGRGGETIKSLQSRTGARIQLVPLQGPPDYNNSGAVSERVLTLAGNKQQIDAASELIKELLSETRTRAPAMQGGFNQQVYPPGPPPMWAPQGGPPPMQQQGYGYQHQSYGYQQYPGPPQPYGSHYAQPPNGWNIPPPPPAQQYPPSNSFGYYEQAQTGYGEGYEQAAYAEQPPGTSNESYAQHGGESFGQPDAYGQVHLAHENYGPPGVQSAYGPPGAAPSHYDQLETSQEGYGHLQPSDQGGYGHDRPTEISYDGQYELQGRDEEASNEEDPRSALAPDKYYRGPIDAQGYGNHGYGHYSSNASSYWQPPTAGETEINQEEYSQVPLHGSQQEYSLQDTGGQSQQGHLHAQPPNLRSVAPLESYDQEAGREQIEYDQEGGGHAYLHNGQDGSSHSRQEHYAHHRDANDMDRGATQAASFRSEHEEAKEPRS